MPDHIHKALAKARYTDKNPEVQLAFLVGFLSGSLEAARIRRRGEKALTRWALECEEESRQMIAEVDESVLSELQFRRTTQGN